MNNSRNLLLEQNNISTVRSKAPLRWHQKKTGWTSYKTPTNPVSEPSTEKMNCYNLFEKKKPQTFDPNATS